MISLVQLHPNDTVMRATIIIHAADGIRAELAARADPEFAAMTNTALQPEAAPALLNGKGKSVGLLYHAMAPALRVHRAVALAALQEDLAVLEHLPAELRGDREIVMGAVRKRGRVLPYASEALRGDRTVVETALDSERSNCEYMYALQYASMALRADRAMALRAVQISHYVFKFVSEVLHRNLGYKPLHFELPAVQNLHVEYMYSKPRYTAQLMKNSGL
jgi:hypothetical protein